MKPTHIKGQLTLKWKVDPEVSGYEIQYSTDKEFKKNVVNKEITKVGTNSKICNGLKAGKVYYISIRTYKTVFGKDYHSEWSRSKRVVM